MDTKSNQALDLDGIADDLNAKRPRPLSLARIDRIRAGFEGEPEIRLSPRPDGGFAPSPGFYVVDDDAEKAISIQLSPRDKARQMWGPYADEIRPREPTGLPIEWLVIPLDYVPTFTDRLDAHGFRLLDEVFCR